MKARKTSNALDIVQKVFYRGRPARMAGLQQTREEAAVARQIHELRERAGLSQKQLAKLIHTTQSAISRLEDADYDGHSLEMLHRIAFALNQRIVVRFEPLKRRRGKADAPATSRG